MTDDLTGADMQVIADTWRERTLHFKGKAEVAEGFLTALLVELGRIKDMRVNRLKVIGNVHLIAQKAIRELAGPDQPKPWRSEDPVQECPLCGLHPYDFTVEEYERELDRLQAVINGTTLAESGQEPEAPRRRSRNPNGEMADGSDSASVDRTQPGLKPPH